VLRAVVEGGSFAVTGFNIAELVYISTIDEAWNTGPVTKTAVEPRWLSAEEQHAWRAYLRGSRLLEAALDKDLQSHGVQLSEYEIISMLSESPGRRLRMSGLAELVVQSRSRLTHTAARLERRGWVRRESCLEDRRGVELVLTQEGWDAVQDMARVHVDSVRRHLVDTMPPELFAALGNAMDAVSAAITESGAAEGHELR
jgi:DNA-binding MarR family transcriptional regulator